MSDGAQQRQALADRIRGEHIRSARRQWVIAIVAASILIVVAAAGVAITFLVRLHTQAEATIAAPRNADDAYGFTLTPALAGGPDVADAVPVSIYEDFLCPSCKAFHDEAGPWLSEQVASGHISVTYHPLTFLLQQSTDEYSQRAANAAVCVADEAGVPAYVAMHDLLLANQPAEGGPGLTDEHLIELAGQAGAADVGACVADRTFTPWLEQALQAGLDAEVTTTPTVRIMGLNVVRSQDGRESVPGIPELEFTLGALR